MTYSNLNVLVNFTSVNAADPVEPNFQAPGNYKKPESIAKYVEETRNNYYDGGGAMKDVYNANIWSASFTFGAETGDGKYEAQDLLDTSSVYGDSLGREQGNEAAKTVAQRLVQLCSDPDHQVVFYGFGIRFFLKNVAIRSALAGFSVPADLWINSRNYVDLESVICPAGDTELSADQACKILTGETLEAVKSSTDLQIALASTLGIL